VKPKPPVSSFFAKKEPVKAKASKAVKEEEEPVKEESPVKDEEEGEDELDDLDDEEQEEQENKAAKKLYVLLNSLKTLADMGRASIFTKNFKSQPVADKGWKEGEAWVSPCMRVRTC
jgi:DNA ligase-1